MNLFYRIAVLAIVLTGVQIARADEAENLAASVQATMAGALKAAQTVQSDQTRVHQLALSTTCNNSLYITNANGAVASRQTGGCTAYGVNQKFPRDLVRSALQSMGWPLLFKAGGFDLFMTTTTFTTVPGGAMYVMVHYDTSDLSSEATFFNERVY
jgi:hypothetical protein